MDLTGKLCLIGLSSVWLSLPPEGNGMTLGGFRDHVVTVIKDDPSNMSWTSYPNSFPVTYVFVLLADGRTGYVPRDHIRKVRGT